MKNVVEKKEQKAMDEAEAERIADAGNALRFDAAGRAMVPLATCELEVLGNFGAGADTQLVLLLNGCNDEAASFASIGSALQGAGMRWLAVNFPGIGASTGTKVSFKVDQVRDKGQALEVIESLLDWLGEPKVSVVGRDFGGLVAIFLAKLKPKRISKYALIADAVRKKDLMATGQGTEDIMVWWQAQSDGKVAELCQKGKKSPALFFWPSKNEVTNRTITGPFKNLGKGMEALLKCSCECHAGMDEEQIGQRLAAALCK